MKFPNYIQVLSVLPAVLPVSSVQGFSLRTNTVPTNRTGFPPCDALISAGLAERVLLATSDDYETTVGSWYSASGRMRPWCFLQPQTTEEVSNAMVTLSDAGAGAGDWHIAVRSGGHGLPQSNNIENGVTIDLSLLNSSNYDLESNTASVYSGARWGHVLTHLHEKHDVMVTGGRNALVGVGGFLLGGGNSFFTGITGFACDSVKNFEVVLANGTILDANTQQNQDLWKALKGGGPNFGLVTRFDLEAMPARDIAKGERIMPSNQSDEVVNAVVAFTDKSVEQPEDHLFALYMHNTNISEDYTIMVTTVNVQGNLETTAFDQIREIPALQETWEAMAYEEAADAGSIPDGMKGVQSTITFLNEPHNLQYAAKLHKELVETLSANIGADNYITTMFFQPLPTYFAEIGEKKGGNVLGLNHIPDNAILWVLAVGVTSGDDAAVAIAQSTLIAATDKMKDQDPLGSYGADNLALMRDVAEKYDPEGFWQKRIPGGFKVSRAGV